MGLLAYSILVAGVVARANIARQILIVGLMEMGRGILVDSEEDENERPTFVRTTTIQRVTTPRSSIWAHFRELDVNLFQDDEDDEAA